MSLALVKPFEVFGEFISTAGTSWLCVQTIEDSICQHFLCWNLVGLSIILKHPAIYIRTGNLATATAVGLLYGPENVLTVDKNGGRRKEMILLCNLRCCHFTLLIIHRIARQFQSGAENGNDFIQDGIRTNATVTGVQVEIQILNEKRPALHRLRLSSAAASRGGVRVFSRVSYIRDRTRRAFLLTAVAMVDTPIGIYNNRNGRFLLIINTMA